MSHSLAAPETSESFAGKARLWNGIDSFSWRAGIIGAAFLGLWLEVVNHLRMEWTVNPQYSYGWIVPFLALFLLYNRWRERPAPEAARWVFPSLLLSAMGALLLLPARIISIANPDWRLLSWVLAGIALFISFSALNLAGGLRWVRHFGFPLAFFLVATPWPAQFEQSIVQGLMRADAALVVHVLNAIGTIAIQRGNVIELSTGLVGIADACTGIRSLQSTLMISLFLGEFYRMTVRRRVVLVVAAAALAFLCNLARTLLLCLVASASGVEAIHTWHDSAGLTILLVSISGLWLLSLWLKQKDEARRYPLSTTAARRTGTHWKYSFALALWIAATEIAAASWYHTRGASLASAVSWSVAWPEQQPGYAATKVPEAAEELLLYNEGGGANWRGADGHQWLMYYFRWLPGRTAALFVKNHRPDICLPASGMTMQSESALRVLSANGVQLPFRSYRFEARGQNLDVFYCYWDGRSSYTDDKSALQEDWTARGRLEAAWKGQREIGARMLEVVVWGYDRKEDADDALQRELAHLIVRG